MDYNFVKKETLAQAFSCKFYEISRNTFSYRTSPLAASKRAIWFSDKGLKERERNRDLKSTAVNRNNITISCINAIKRPFHVSDNIYGSLSGLSCRCFFKIMNFFDGFRQCFKAFSQLREVAVREFSGTSKKILKKTAWWSLGLLMLQRGVFWSQSNNYDGAFCESS